MADTGTRQITYVRLDDIREAAHRPNQRRHHGCRDTPGGATNARRRRAGRTSSGPHGG